MQPDGRAALTVRPGARVAGDELGGAAAQFASAGAVLSDLTTPNPASALVLERRLRVEVCVLPGLRHAVSQALTLCAP